MLVNVTVGFEDVALLRPVDGDHEYVIPATEGAPIVPDACEQIEISDPAFAVGGTQHDKVVLRTAGISATQPRLFHTPISPSAYVFIDTEQSVWPLVHAMDVLALSWKQTCQSSVLLQAGKLLSP